MLILLLKRGDRSGANSGMAGTGVANDNAVDVMASIPDPQLEGTDNSDGLVEVPAEENDGGNADANTGEEQSDALEGETKESNPENDAGSIDWTREEGDLFATTGTQGIGSFSQVGVKMFGIQGKGRHIVYIIDRSSSMEKAVYNHDGDVGSAVTTRFEVACTELLRSVDALNPDQVFTVLFFNKLSLHDKRFVACSPTNENREKLKKWISKIGPDGDTNPLPAITAAFDTSFVPEVDVVFLLSDGDFKKEFVSQIKRLNSGRAVIHTISMPSNATTLEQIASENGGRSVTAK